jgi:uncharacterized coiled-coil protein SlyX
MKLPELPWWLNPWHEVRHQDKMLALAAQQASTWQERSAVNALACADYERRIKDLCDTAAMDIRTIHQLENDLAQAHRRVASLRGQLAAAVTDAKTSGAALSTAAPEFVLVGIPRGPGLGKRLMACRDPVVTAFAMTEMNDPPPRWKLGAILERLLVIDKPTYGEALNHMATIWGNWDRDEKTAIASASPAEPGLARSQIGKGWTDVGATDEGFRWDSSVQGLPAPGVGPPADADAVDGKAGQAEAGQAEDLAVGHPAQESGQATDDEEQNRK